MHLQDYVKRRALPPELKCRMIFPSGAVSMSLWDASSQGELQNWLDASLAETEPGLVNEVHEVQVGARLVDAMPKHHEIILFH